MDTQEILDIALSLAKQSEVPADTTINVPVKGVRKALFGIDARTRRISSWRRRKGTTS